MSVREKLGARTYKGGLEFDILEAGPDKAVATMPVTDSMLNPFGTVHAGAMIWFADVTATVCAIGDPDSVAADGSNFPLAVDLHTVLAGNQKDGILTATAIPVRRGRNMVVIRTEVTGKDGKLLISMTTTHVAAR